MLGLPTQNESAGTLFASGAPTSLSELVVMVTVNRSPGTLLVVPFISDDDDVYYCIRWRLKLEGETENMCVCTKERKS